MRPLLIIGSVLITLIAAYVLALMVVSAVTFDAMHEGRQVGGGG